MTAAEPLRVLIATTAVEGRSGTDVYTRDLALALLRRGLVPAVYTPRVGAAAEELRRAMIPVVDRIEAVRARPDVIHGHHVLETLTAAARFPGVPALFVCHDAVNWHSIPPQSRRIQAWVAVDRNCRDRMMFQHGVPEEAIHVFTNAVDLARFARRGPLPPRPRRALVFSNNAAEAVYVAPIRAACAKRGISVDVIGFTAGTTTDAPETILPQYDLVFAKARCALEAAAVGTAVVICDMHGLAGLLTTDALEAMRQLNFGVRTLQRPLSAETIGAEIDRYDPDQAAAVCERIRASAGFDVLADQYVALYEELRRAGVPLSAEEELEELARALSAVSRSLRPPPLPASARIKLALLNSRTLSPVMRVLYRTKKRLRF